MPPLDRTVLLLGEEAELVERYAALLRKSSLSVRPLVGPAAELRWAEETPPDLLIALLPLAGVGLAFGTLRAAGSPWRQVSLLVIGDRRTLHELDRAVLEIANRVLPPSPGERELQQALDDLLDVAPRVKVRASVRARFQLAPDELKSFPVENVSETGMLLRSLDPVPVGSVFGFLLELESEREPIRGQAGVVRLADGASRGFGVGVRILSFGGDGAARLGRLAGRRLSASQRTRSTEVARPASGTGSFRTPAEELARASEELAQLQPILDQHLERGLTRRLASADWYLTGGELGLDSLRAFSTILDAVHGGRGANAEPAACLVDLQEVRVRLGEFVSSRQEVRVRVATLVAVRPALERLMRELGDGASVESSRAPRSGVVAQAVTDIRRLVGARRSLRTLHDQLVDLDSKRYLFARAALRRAADRICADYRPFLAPMGFAVAERLLHHKNRRVAIAAAERDARQYEQRLASVHERVFGRRFAHLATGHLEADLLQPALESVMFQVLAAGREFLGRLHSIYRHSLELATGDAAMLERAARLDASIRAATRALAARPAGEESRAS